MFGAIARLGGYLEHRKNSHIGIDRRWTAKAEHLSPRYTTRLDELVRA
ncbi:MAG: DUF4113 domain-containing protein [Nostoc sp.]